MNSKTKTFLKTYYLNILLVIVFVVAYILTQFVHNIFVYKWLFLEYLTGIELQSEVVANNKYFLQDFIFSAILVSCSILVDYFRTLFYPEKYLERVFFACGTVFIIFILNWIIFEIFGSLEHNSLYYNPNQRTSPTHSVNMLLILDVFLLVTTIGVIFLLERLSIVQKINQYVKNILLKFGDTNQA